MTFLCQNPLPKLPIGISSFARLRAGTLRRGAMNPDSPDAPSPAKLPVGVSEFRQLRDEGFWYADKTRFIEELENNGWPYNVFVRPKGFGKTVFLSMLEAYYDRYGARDFERLFADTYIARHKTPYQGAFRVLRLDFADVADPADGSRALCEAIRKGFTDFFRRYPIPHWKTLLEKECDFPGSLLHDLLSEVRYRSESPRYVGEIIRSLGNGRAVPNNGGCRFGDRFFFRYSGLLTLLFGLGYLTLSLEGENDLIGPTRDMERRFAQLADEIRNQYPDARC